MVRRFLATNPPMETVLAPPVLNRHVRKTPINQIGVVCTDTAVSQTKTKKRKQQTKRFSFEPLLAGASNGSFETHAPRCHPKSSTCRGSYSARLSFIRSASVIALALLSALNVFAAASFKPLPYTDPFPPAATPGNTTVLPAIKFGHPQ